MYKSPNFMKSFLPLTVIALMGAFSGQAFAALAPNSCEDISAAQIDKKEQVKGAIDKLKEYDDAVRSYDAKAQCLAKLSELMSANVGSGKGMLGYIAGNIQDYLNDSACEQVSDMANQARQEALGRIDQVNDAIDGAVDGAIDKVVDEKINPIFGGNVGEAINVIDKGNVIRDTVGNTVKENTLPSIYDRLGKLY